MIQYRVSTFNFDNSENVAYDNPLFPAYIRKGRFSYPSNYSSIPHWHEDLEFFVLLSGSITYVTDGETAKLTSPSGIFINSRHMHHLFMSGCEDCEFICILLNPVLLIANTDFEQRFVDPFIRNPECSYMVLEHSIVWQQQILTLLTDLANHQEHFMIEAMIQSSFFRIFQLLFENTHTSLVHNASYMNLERLNTLKKMILFIQEHYEEAISLQDIASSIPCSKSKCIKLFNEYLKEPPVTYLIKYRLSKSCNLLTTTDNSITEIALECGFRGSSYFCELFKKYYGLTPHAYKEQVVRTILE